MDIPVLHCYAKMNSSRSPQIAAIFRANAFNDPYLSLELWRSLCDRNRNTTAKTH
uniref:Uncharacterized protein n=1 Tax=Arundo donax TaxID=35708 RepID=A0A0A9CAV1_ARUDO